MPRVTLEQAAVNALRKHLEGELRPVFGTKLVIDDRWPSPDQQLPEKAITILRAGAPVDERIDQEVVKAEPIAGGNKTLFTWRWAARRQALQIDVWAHDDTVRDWLKAELERAEHVGVGKTLGIANADPIRDGVLLKLDLAGDGWEGFADFTFDPPGDNDPPGARDREYRATQRGSVDVILTFKAESPRLLFVNIAMALSELGLPAPQLPGQQTDTYSINLATDGVTHTSP
jgi:hypothetical protein